MGVEIRQESMSLAGSTDTRTTTDLSEEMSTEYVLREQNRTSSPNKSSDTSYRIRSYSSSNTKTNNTKHEKGHLRNHNRKTKRINSKITSLERSRSPLGPTDQIGRISEERT